MFVYFIYFTLNKCSMSRLISIFDSFLQPDTNLKPQAGLLASASEQVCLCQRWFKISNRLPPSTAAHCVCYLTCGLMSPSSAMVMSGCCLHFLGLLTNIRMS